MRIFCGLMAHPIGGSQLNTYTFEPAFIPDHEFGPRGTYLIPSAASFIHDEMRLETVLAAHPDVTATSWDSFDGFAALGLCGDGPVVTPVPMFTYTDADLVILEAQLATEEAASNSAPVYTLEQIAEMVNREGDQGKDST